MIPFRDFDGWLKQIRGEDLSASERLAVDCVFPSLAAPDAAAIEAAERHLRKTNEGYASGDTIERMVPSVRVNRRRYAGDHTLGPRNYHTVALDERGDDGSTLIAELAAYSDDSVGACSAHDRVTPAAAHQLGVQHRERCILLQFHGTPGSNAALARIGTRMMWIPYRVERTRIERVIDLRHPDLQHWFHGEFADFHRHTMRSLETVKKPGAELPSLSHHERPDSFDAMLPVLMDPERGGNTVTDHIGQWMRLSGVNALVYPSARLPVGVVWDGNDMSRWQGWNLVDYRGRDRQLYQATTVILGGDPWQSPHAGRFTLERRGASWMMMPPKMTFHSRRPVADDDLRVRFRAGESIFGGLITLAVEHQRATEEAWLESLHAACETVLGKQILGYMGIGAAWTLDAGDGGLAAVLFECWRLDEDPASLSKGFACVRVGDIKLDASLDPLVNELASGVPRFVPIRDGMHIYLLREDR